MAILLLLLAAHILKFLQFAPYGLKYSHQRIRLLHIYVLRFPSLNFGDLVVYIAHIFG